MIRANKELKGLCQPDILLTCLLKNPTVKIIYNQKGQILSSIENNDRRSTNECHIQNMVLKSTQ